MTKARKKVSPKTQKKPLSRSAEAKPTVSGPTRPSVRNDTRDALESKMAATGDLAAQMPFNTLKPLEFDPRAHKAPGEGPAFEPADPLAAASTITETTASDKVGSGAPPVGNNMTIAPLDRVRSDASARALTTNQGVPVGDNQNSLKAGLRGPVLWEDFIRSEERRVGKECRSRWWPDH